MNLLRENYKIGKINSINYKNNIIESNVNNKCNQMIKSVLIINESIIDRWIINQSVINR